MLPKEEPEKVEQNPEMTVAKGFFIYLGLAAAMIALIQLATALSWFPGLIPLAAYFVCGVLLNRLVLRGLIEWHPVYNTVANVSSGKLRSFLFWPFFYPALFFRLSVIKHL